MSLNRVHLNKVYRFDYTDQQRRNRGRRTALIVSGCVGNSGTTASVNDHYSLKCLDLEKGEYRNFIPSSMANIVEVPAEVGYVNMQSLPPALVGKTVQLFEKEGFTVYRDFPHINAVKGWKPKEKSVKIARVNYNGYQGLHLTAREVEYPNHLVATYVSEGAFYVWQGDYYKAYPLDSREGLKDLRDRLDSFLKATEAASY